MLSKTQIKLIKSLAQKKFREKNGLFVVEGIKGVEEFVNSDIELYHLYSTEKVFKVQSEHFSLISDAQLKQISQLKTPNKALGIFKMPKPKTIDESQLILALDAVRDPGNLGTIIRLCDWFGINDLVCSKTTVDCFNPKVVQASMGSLTRVNICYIDLDRFLESTESIKYGTFMEGDSIYNTSLPDKGVLIMGNEANGISETIERLIDKKLCIPRFGNLKATESLNVATATSICLSEFKRFTI